MDDSLEIYRKAALDTFNSQYDNLCLALQGCMTKFIEEAFAAGLISESVMRSENFPKIANEFKTRLKLRNTLEDVQTHFHCLIKILKNLGGPAAIVGNNLEVDVSILATRYRGMSMTMY